MIYPEDHTLADANLCWSGVEAQGSPNATEVHHNLLEPSQQDGRPDHYGTFEGGHRTHIKLDNLHNSIGGSQESPLRHHRAWEDLHNLIGGPKKIATKAPQSLERSPQLN
jgi:hypothetical protein